MKELGGVFQVNGTSISSSPGDRMREGSPTPCPKRDCPARPSVLKDHPRAQAWPTHSSGGGWGLEQTVPSTELEQNGVWTKSHLEKIDEGEEGSGVFRIIRGGERACWATGVIQASFVVLI